MEFNFHNFVEFCCELDSFKNYPMRLVLVYMPRIEVSESGDELEKLREEVDLIYSYLARNVAEQHKAELEKSVNKINNAIIEKLIIYPIINNESENPDTDDNS